MTEADLVTWIEAMDSGCVPPSFVERWADEQVIRLDTPPIWLLDLCVAPSAADARTCLYRGLAESWNPIVWSPEVANLRGRLHLGCLFLCYERGDIGWPYLLGSANANGAVRDFLEHGSPEGSLNDLISAYENSDFDLLASLQGAARVRAAFLPHALLAREHLGRVSPCHKTRPAALDPDWLRWADAFVPTLARSVYEGRRFEEMPILGDALEDAGCDDPEILSHLREPGPHVRGCWVLESILSKE